MIEYLLDNSLFYVIPDDIDHAEVCSIDDVSDNMLKLKAPDKIEMKPNEKAEVFVNSSEGIIYFISVINDVNSNNLIIDLPLDYEILQRRENKRVVINEEITIKCESFEKKVLLEDISVGGMKILTDEQISLNREYDACLNFDNINLTCKYVPQRISSQKLPDKEMYKISGVIELQSPKDKIELVQYCYKKLYEKTYRK